MKIIKKIEDYPIIYLRYFNNKLLYIGESHSFIKGRHVREEGVFDLVKVLKAPKNIKRRKYWEAYLICKLNPLRQNQRTYRYLVEKTNNREFKKSKYRPMLLEERVDKKEILYSAYLNLERFKECINLYKKLK